MDYFTEQDLINVKKQRKKMLTIYFIIMGVFIAASAGLITWYVLLPFESPTISVVKWIHYPITGLFVIFSFVYLGMPFKRVNRFYKLCHNMHTGHRETSVGSFFEYDADIQDKDGVDVKSLIFLEWNKYKKDFFERKVLVFYEREFPEFTQNQNVKYVTQGNVLISYEILDEQE